MRKTIFITLFITFQLALLSAGDRLTESYLIESKWSADDDYVSLVFKPGNKVSLVEKYFDAVLYFDGKYTIKRDELLIQFELDTEESSSRHRKLDNERLTVRFKLLNDLNTVDYDHFLIFEEVVKSENVPDFMLAKYRWKWKRITNLNSKLKENTKRKFNGVRVITIDNRRTICIENAKFHPTPDSSSDYYIWYRKIGESKEPPPYMPKGTGITLRARTAKRYKVKGSYNYWYYIDIDDLHPLDDGVFLNTDKKRSHVFYGFWVFGEFIEERP